LAQNTAKVMSSHAADLMSMQNFFSNYLKNNSTYQHRNYCCGVKYTSH